MTSSVRAAAVAFFLLGSLAGCGDDQSRADEPAPDAPCLVTVDQLQKITANAEEIREVESPGGGLGTELSCDTPADERGVSMDWFLQKSSTNPPPTHEELRALAEDPAMETEEADLGDAEPGWVSAGRPIGLAEAQVIAIVDGLLLEVNVISTDHDSQLTVQEMRDEAVAVARVIVAARNE